MGTRPKLTFHPRPCFSDGSLVVTRLRSHLSWRVLQILAESGTWTERTDVSTELWPDLDPKRARQNLRQCLLYIRQSIPESASWLVAEGMRLRLDFDRVDVSLDLDEPVEHEFEASKMPRLAAVFARLDDDARRTAVSAMTPAWIASGCHAEGLDEIAKLRRTDAGRLDADLILCQSEILNAAHHSSESVLALDEVERLKEPLPLNLHARFLVNRSHTSARLHQYDSSIRYALLAYDAARTLRDRGIAMRALQLAGTCFVEVGNFRNARRALNLALELTADDLENPGRPFVFLTLSRLELLAQNPEEARLAADRGIESLRLARSQPGVNGMIAARIGRLYESLGDKSRAVANYQSSHEILAETECVQEKAEVYTYLGDAYRAEGELERSLESHERAVRLRRNLKTPDALGTSLRGMGMAAQLLGDHRLAITCLSESAMQFECCGRNIGKASALIPLSRSYFAVNRREEAIPMFARSLEFLDRELVGSRRLQLPLDLSKVDEMKSELNLMASGR